MLPLTSSRLAACLVFTAISSALVGCKPAAAPKTNQDQTLNETSLQTPASPRRPPGTAELASFVRGSLPPVIKLVDLKNDPPVRLPNSAPGSDAWLYNVRLSLAPVEDELGPLPPQEAQAFQARLEELGGLAAWSQAYARSPYASFYPGFVVEVPAPAAPQVLRVLHAKDRPHPPVYAKMAAEWEVDHWQFSMEDAALPADDGGKFRSEFTGPLLIQGDPATERYLAATKEAITQAKAKKDAIERSYQADLLKATQPGTLYRGQIRNRSSTVAAEVRFTAPPAGTDPQQEVQMEVRLPATPGEAFTYLVRRARRLPLRLAASTGTTDQTGSAPTREETEVLPKDDLALSFVSATGKLGAYNDTVPVALLSITRQFSQPSEVTLHARGGAPGW